MANSEKVDKKACLSGVSKSNTVIKWTKIDEKNEPEFNKQYLFGRAKKGFFHPEKVWYGFLHRIEIEGNSKRLMFNMSHEDTLISDVTHYIEIEPLPPVGKPQ